MSGPATGPAPTRYEVTAGVATITLDAPERRNALGQAMLSALLADLAEAEADDEVRVIVLTNTGTTFSAGADLKEGPGGPGERRLTFADLVDAVAAADKPVVGRIAGHAAGGAAAAVVVCDVAVAVDTARIGITETRLGVAPAEVLALLAHRLSDRSLREAFLTGEMLPAARATELGLITAAVPEAELDDAVAAYVSALVKSGPQALATTKRLMRSMAGLAPAQARAVATEVVAASGASGAAGGAERSEGVAAFLAKRPPAWIPEAGGDVAATTGRVTVRGVELAYEVRGEGPTLVWGHGLTGSRAHDDDAGLLRFPELAAAGRVVRYDARGHGRSGGSTEAADSAWSSLAADQLALADALGIDRYVAGGASMGCGTALHAAVLAPERVAGLVLVIPPTAWETRQERVEIWAQLAAVAERQGPEAVLEGMLSQPRPDPFATQPDWDEALARSLRATPPDRLAAVFRGAATADLPARELLAGLAVPTVILAWTGDPSHPVSTAEQLAELIPGARLMVASTFDELAGWTTSVAELVAKV